MPALLHSTRLDWSSLLLLSHRCLALIAYIVCIALLSHFMWPTIVSLLRQTVLLFATNKSINDSNVWPTDESLIGLEINSYKHKHRFAFRLNRRLISPFVVIVCHYFLYFTFIAIFSYCRTDGRMTPLMISSVEWSSRDRRVTIAWPSPDQQTITCAQLTQTDSQLINQSISSGQFIEDRIAITWANGQLS